MLFPFSVSAALAAVDRSRVLIGLCLLVGIAEPASSFGTEGDVIVDEVGGCLSDNQFGGVGV